MEDMVKEVLDYINPKPVVEAPVDKGKKPPPKGKVEEVQPVDQYAGMDTKEYKEIGQQIKRLMGDDVQTGNRDLVSMITDDSLLVRLFIQKLKLTFPLEKSEQAKQDEILHNLAKEKEILD